MINFQLNKNKITFENRKEFTLSKEVISEYNLKEKDFLENEEYTQLMNRVVKSYSIYLLAKKDYFEKDLKTKLETVYQDREIVLEVIDWLKRKGYINDENLIEQYIESHRNYGIKKLEYNLLMKGINKNILKNYLEDTLEKQFQEIERILIKKEKDPLEKVIQGLMRKGFQYQDIKKVIDSRSEK